ncbi:Hsp70 protein-domain-containing protein [Melampsora americana]|nr:Hsp70 protein-domain-containing protein [Melampsora americana]
MTSVVGIDLGNEKSKVGLARNRGIDIICNEVSNRTTPSLVAFGLKNRTIGESAKTQETSNFKNTIGSLKRLIGRTSQDHDVTEIESKFLNSSLIDLNGTLGVKVDYLGQEETFTITQLYAAYLGKLRDIAQAELKNTVNDVVIAVPGWYTDIQRRAVLDAAEIANLHPLRLINELTATALGYGITKTDLPPLEETPRYVAFVDIGHSQYQVAIVAFNKATLTVKGFAYDHHFGGRNLDYALLQHFATEFKEKYKIDVLANKKAVFRLAAAVEKLKCVLSANAQAPLNVESIMNDIDASSSMTRETLEELIAPLLEKTTQPLERALAQAGIPKDAIETVELVGGSTRVPALKSRIQEFFGKPLSFTCNQDEAVARGATLACAGLSPIFKVREFSVNDIANYSIRTEWQPTPDDPQTSLDTFTPESLVPSGKLLSFHRSEPFELVVSYSEPSQLPGGINPIIGRYVINQVSPTAKGEPVLVKVKAKLNASGLTVFEGATAHEEIAGEDKEEEGGKKKVTKKELTSTFLTSSLSKEILNNFLAKEGEMYAGDKLVAETEDRKNALEEYVYDTREKLDGTFAPYVSSEVKEKFKVALQSAEDWLYTEEDPIKFRQREAEDRPRAERALRETIGDYMQRIQSGDAKYSHLVESDLQIVVEKCASAEKWIGDSIAKQAEKAKDEVPAVTSNEIWKRKESLVYDCMTIFNKPAPKASVPTPQTNEKTEENTEATNEEVKVEEAEGANVTEGSGGGGNGTGSMDVD